MKVIIILFPSPSFSPKDDIYNKCCPYRYQWFDLSIKRNLITWSSETNDHITPKKVTKKELINVKKTTQRIFSMLLLWWPYIHYITFTETAPSEEIVKKQQNILSVSIFSHISKHQRKLFLVASSIYPLKTNRKYLVALFPQIQISAV